MATTPNSAITPQKPYLGTCSLAAVGACTTRAPTLVSGAAAANIFPVVSLVATTDGFRVDRVNVKACSNVITAPSAAQCVTLWVSDGTTLWPQTGEIVTTVVTPSAIVASGEWQSNYDRLQVEAGESLYVSTTVATTAATTALAVTVTGAAL